MKISIANCIFFILAFAAILMWRMDRHYFDSVLKHYGEEQRESDEEIIGGHVEDSFRIGDLVFVYPYGEGGDSEKENTINELPHPAEIIKTACPNAAIQALVNEQLGGEHGYSLYNISLGGNFYESYEDEDLELQASESEPKRIGNSIVWKVIWELHDVNVSFSSGRPWLYISYQRADGTAIPPRIFLRDFFGSSYSERDQIFSVISLAELKPVSNEPPAESALISTAKTELEKALQKLEETTQFRYHSIKRRTFSRQLIDPQLIGDLEVWGVNFVDNSVRPEDANENPAFGITVWITSDLHTSQITNYWQIKTE